MCVYVWQGAPVMMCKWTEHDAPDGRKYYYNSESQESVWEKPKELADFQVGVTDMMMDKKTNFGKELAYKFSQIFVYSWKCN
jgi:hypothetical protein